MDDLKKMKENMKEGESPPSPPNDSSQTSPTPPSSPPPKDSSSSSPPPKDSSSSPPPKDSSSSPPQNDSSSSPPPPSPTSTPPPQSPPPPEESPPPPKESSSSPPPTPPKSSSTPPPTPPNSSSTPPPPSPSLPSPSTTPSPPSTDNPPPPSSSSNTPPPSPPSSENTPPPKESLPPPSPKDPSNSPKEPPPQIPEIPPSPSGMQAPPGTPFAPPSKIAPPDGTGGSGRAPLGPPTPNSSSSSSKSSPSDSRSASPSSSSPSSSSSHSSTNATGTVVVGVVVFGAIVLSLAIVCVVCSKKKKKRRHDQYYNTAFQGNNSRQPMDHVIKFQSPPVQGVTGVWGTGSDQSVVNSGQHNQNPSPLGGVGGYSSQNQFSYQDLATATSGFSQDKLLGQGGFGYVHKGVLPDGRLVAVKSLKAGSGQGEREFQAEVEIISRVHHRHLVSLVGYCIAESQRMLVYEFVSNKTLEHHLHGKGLPVMGWSSRMRIALGSSKGLAYLHEDCHPRIIHRDIKAANILLDDNYEAMVADFGLAKLSSDNITHVSTRVMGTFGYLAPEYASSGKLSDKSDVFSFGVMLLELITGRRPVDPTDVMEDSLVDWSRPLTTKALKDGNYVEIADPRMEGNYVPDEMARVAACASASVRHSAKRRPRMSQIVRSLEGDLPLDDMNATNLSNGPSPSSSYDTGAYNADMMKFRKMVLNTGDIPSSEYGSTSEYVFNPSAPTSDSESKGLPGQHMNKN